MTPLSGHAEQASKSKTVTSGELRVNLNTSSAVELTQLPGVGEKVAARVVAYRKENGPFQKIEEIMNVKGIGEKTFTRLRSHLFIDPEPKKKKQ
jgi:competence protein ComEA